MDLLVRPALPTDRCVPLLFDSARPYYTAYAGSERRALALLEAVFAVPGHAASYDCCTVVLDRTGLGPASTSNVNVPASQHLADLIAELDGPEQCGAAVRSSTEVRGGAPLLRGRDRPS